MASSMTMELVIENISATHTEKVARPWPEHAFFDPPCSKANSSKISTAGNSVGIPVLKGTSCMRIQRLFTNPILSVALNGLSGTVQWMDLLS
jgi:hypothetical protein